MMRQDLCRQAMPRRARLIPPRCHHGKRKGPVRGQPTLGTKFTNARLAGEGIMLHLYYTALFAVIVANVITVLFIIAIAINGRKRDN